jgi:hypothetical protein
MATDMGPLWIAMGLSLILIAVIIIIAAFIHYFGRKAAIERQKKQFTMQDLVIPPKDFILVRILLDKDDHASLSAFQLLAWTLLIAFLYIALWFFNLRSGITTPPQPIPEGLMALMGISVGVPLVNKVIMDYKENKARPEGEEYNEPVYASMLEENGKPSLLRLQMFLWTIASLVIYFWYFITMAMAVADVSTLALPPVDDSLLFLMGLSQTGYLGSKAFAGTVTGTEKKTAAVATTTAAPAAPAAPARQPLSLREIVPRAVKSGGLVTLLGTGFGTKPDTLSAGAVTVPQENVRRWDDTRIEFTLPGSVAAGKTELRIIAGGNSVSDTITVGDPDWVNHAREEVPADITGPMWIDDPNMRYYRVPPIGHFIPKKRYYFFFEYEVPPGTPSWGRTQFAARLYINDKAVGDKKSFLPGYMNGKNYGVFDHTFDDPGKFTIEIRGNNAVKMDIEVKERKVP